MSNLSDQNPAKADKTATNNANNINDNHRKQLENDKNKLASDLAEKQKNCESLQKELESQKVLIQEKDKEITKKNDELKALKASTENDLKKKDQELNKEKSDKNSLIIALKNVKDEILVKDKEIKELNEKLKTQNQEINNIKKENMKIKQQNDNLTKKFDDFAKVVKLSPDNLQKIVKKSTEDNNAIETYMEINKTLTIQLNEVQDNEKMLQETISKLNKDKELLQQENQLLQEISLQKESFEVDKQLLELELSEKSEENRLLFEKIEQLSLELQEKSQDIANFLDEIQGLERKLEEEEALHKKNEDSIFFESQQMRKLLEIESKEKERKNKENLLFHQENTRLFEENQAIRQSYALLLQEMETHFQLEREIASFDQKLENIALLSFLQEKEQDIEDLFACTETLEQEIIGRDRVISSKNMEIDRNIKNLLKYEAEISRLSNEKLESSQRTKRFIENLTKSSEIFEEEGANSEKNQENATLRNQFQVIIQGLSEEIESLKSENERISQENQELREKLAVSPPSSPQKQQVLRKDTEVSQRVSVINSISEENEENAANTLTPPRISINKAEEFPEYCQENGENEQEIDEFRMNDINYKELYAKSQEQFEKMQEEAGNYRKLVQELEEKQRVEKEKNHEICEKNEALGKQIKEKEAEIAKIKRDFVNFTGERLRILKEIQVLKEENQGLRLESQLKEEKIKEISSKLNENQQTIENQGIHEIESLKTENQELRTQVISLKEAISTESEEKCRLEDSCKEKLEDYSRILQEKEILQKNLVVFKELEEENRKLRLEIEENQRNYEENEEKFLSLRQENEELQNKLANFQRKEEEFLEKIKSPEENNAKNHENEGSLLINAKEIELENKKLQRELENFKEKNAELLENLKNFKHLEERVAEKDRKLEELTQKIRESSEIIKKNEEYRQKMQQKYEEKLKESSEILKKNEEYGQNLEEVEQKLEANLKENEVLLQIQRKQSENNEDSGKLSSKHDEKIEDLTKKYEELSRNYNEKLAEIAEKNQQNLQEKLKENEDLRDKLREIHDKYRENAEKHQELQQKFEEKLEDLTRTNEKLSRRCNELQSEITESSKFQRELQEKLSENAEIKKNNEELTTKIREKALENSQLNEKISQISTELAEKSSEICDLRAKIAQTSELSSKLDEKTSENSELVKLHRKTTTVLLREKQEIQEDNEKLQENNEKLQENNKHLQENIDILHQKLAEIEQLRQLSEEKVKEITRSSEKRIEDALSHEERLIKDFKAKETQYLERIREFQGKNEELLQKNQGITEKLRELDRVFQQEMREKAKMEGQLSEKLQFLQAFHILKMNEHTYQQEIAKLQQKLEESEKTRENLENQGKNLENAHKTEEFSMKAGLLLFSEHLTNKFVEKLRFFERKLKERSQKLMNLSRNFQEIAPLLTILKDFLRSPDKTSRDMLKNLTKLLISRQKPAIFPAKPLESPIKHGFSFTNTSKNTNFFASTGDSSVFPRESPAKASNPDEMLDNFSKLLGNSAILIEKTHGLSLCEANFRSSWQIFEFFQEILMVFKGLLVESPGNSPPNSEIRAIYQDFVSVLKEQNAQFSQKYEVFQRNLATLWDSPDKFREFSGNFCELMQKIAGKKGNIKKMGVLLQENMKKTVETLVNEEIRKFLEKRPKNYDFLYNKALINRENGSNSH